MLIIIFYIKYNNRRTCNESEVLCFIAKDDNDNGYSILSALRAISDEKSLALLKSIATLKPRSTILISKLNITSKEYYTRLSHLRGAGLIGKRDADYFLTSFGKIVYESICLIEKAASSNWKLKSIDSIKLSKGLPYKEYNNLINMLIEDNTMKKILYIPDESFENSSPFCGTKRENY